MARFRHALLSASEITIKSITALLWLSLAIGNVQAGGNTPAANWLLLVIGMGSLGAAESKPELLALTPPKGGFPANKTLRKLCLPFYRPKNLNT